MKLSEKTLRALKILAEHPEITARSFGRFMWPDSLFHRKHYNTGVHGACAGKGMWLCAGSYLSRLSKATLVTINMDRGLDGRSRAHTFSLTSEGTKIIKRKFQQ